MLTTITYFLLKNTPNFFCVCGVCVCVSCGTPVFQPMFQPLSVGCQPHALGSGQWGGTGELCVTSVTAVSFQGTHREVAETDQ